MPDITLEPSLSVGSANVSSTTTPGVSIEKRRVDGNVQVTWSGISGAEHKTGLYRRATFADAYALIGQSPQSSGGTSAVIVPEVTIGSSGLGDYPRYAIQVKTESAAYIIEDIIKID